MKYLRALPVVLVLLLALSLPSGALGWSNGHAPGSALSPINSGLACNQLSNSAAAGWNTMALGYGKVLPTNGCDSAYRSYARQVYWRNYWCGQGACGNAATPGYSNHGLGLAVDMPQWVRGYVDKTGGKFGFHKPCSDAPQEWWHVKFCAGFNRPNPGLSFKYPVMKNGSGGPVQETYVKRLQKRLNLHGYKGIKADGDFGLKTRSAVKRFQKENGLKPDAIVGQNTWQALAKAPAHDNDDTGGVKPPPTKPKPDHDVPANEPATGVDVSMHQGQINWKAVARGPPDFAVVKATEGEDYKDPFFGKKRLTAIEQAKLVPGVYHFLRPRADRPGSREADWFVNTILDAGYGRGFLPPVADIESTTLSATGTCKYLQSFVDRVEKSLGVEPIIYTYPGFAQSYLGGCSWLGKYNLWIANYGVSKPTIPRPWTSYAAWQYTDSGHTAGINGPVDLNRVNGGMRKLEKLRIGTLKKSLRDEANLGKIAPLGGKPDPVPAAEDEPLDEVPVPEGDATVD